MADYTFPYTGAEIEVLLDSSYESVLRLNASPSSTILGDFSGGYTCELLIEIFVEDVEQVTPVIIASGVVGDLRNLSYIYDSGGVKVAGFVNSSDANLTLPIVPGVVNTFKILQSGHNPLSANYFVIYDQSSGAPFPTLTGMVNKRLIDAVTT